MTFLSKKTVKSTPITLVSSKDFSAWLKKQDKKTQNWVKENDFTGGNGAVLTLPSGKGGIGRVLLGTGKQDIGLYTFSALPKKLPKNPAGYYIDAKLNTEDANKAALGWALGTYEFTDYKTKNKKAAAAKLIFPAKANKKEVKYISEAMFLARDLINMPPNELGPAELAGAARKLIAPFKNKARINVLTNQKLLEKEYPSIYEVGKGSDSAPRLIDIKWGNPKHPKVTLVGKGVTFDTGGLHIKPTRYMTPMKKDMGGAAHVLGLAHMIMSENLPVRLRVLIPAVENSVDGKSFRPSDVIKTRKGLLVEVDNTDAEGRLVLADALTEATREKPDIVIDFATLTGSARTAMGLEVTPIFSNDDKLADAVMKASEKTEDPVWRMPLWQNYLDMLKSDIADIKNCGDSPYAGAITAALYLQQFVDNKTPWIHVDTYGWNASSKPGRPQGGEALSMRAMYEMLKQKYAKKKS